MLDIRREHKFRAGRDRLVRLFLRMFARALWTGLLALLAWLPIGRVESRAFRAEQPHRTLFAVSAIDLADSPARISDGASTSRELAPDRRPTTPRALPRAGAAADRGTTYATEIWRPADNPRPTGWRGFLDRRLILPHDATAPPARRA